LARPPLDTVMPHKYIMIQTDNRGNTGHKRDYKEAEIGRQN